MYNGSMRIQIYPEVTNTSKENIQTHGLDERLLKTGNAVTDLKREWTEQLHIFFSIIIQAVP